MLTDSISAGVVVLIPKATLAVWIALSLLLLTDNRKLTAVPALALAILAAVTGGYRFISAPALPTLDRFLWGIGIGLAGVQLLLQARRWLATSPVERHLQASQVDAPGGQIDRQATKRVSKLRRLRGDQTSHKDQPTAALPTSQLLPIACALAGVLLTGSVLLRSCLQATIADQTLRYSVIVHQLTATALWGLAMVSAFHTTYLSTPDALKPTADHQVRWRLLAGIGAACLVLELALCGLVFYQLEVSPGAGETLAVPVVFLIALLLINFVTWMVPHRIQRFQQGARPKGWASLTLASWLAVLCYGLVLALPVDWPWNLLLN